MMLEAVFSAVLAGLPKVSLEDEDEDEDEQRKDMELADDDNDEDMVLADGNDDEDDDDDEDEDNQQNKMKMSSDKDGDWNFDTARMFCNTDSKAIQPSIFNRIREKEVKSSVDQPKIIRKEGTDMDIFWCIVDALAQECNQRRVEESIHSKFSDVRRHEDQFFALIGDTVSAANGQSISSNYCGHAGGFVNLSRTAPQTGGLAAMKSLGTECVNFSVTDSSLQNRAHRISSADASGRLRPEVDTGVCSTGDCSPFLGLHRADPVSAANGQSVVSNKCGRASGTVNLSRTAPQTTGLISSSEPVAADNSSLLTPDTMPEQTWRVASAAPQHMTGYLNHLIDYTPASGDQVIDTPNMGRMAVHGHGSVNTTNITLQDVLYVPCLDANLVSTGQLAQLGYMSILGPYGCRIYKEDEDMPLVGEAHYVDGYLLELDFLRVRPSTN